MAIRVMLVDDQELVRVGFRVLIGSTDGFEVVAEAADGAEAVALAPRAAPDVVLMDIRMPGVDGIEATRRLVALDPAYGRKVLVLTTFGTDPHVEAALRAGASGFLLKDARPERLFEAVRAVARGDAWLDPGVTRAVIREFATRPATVPTGPLEALSDREREVLALVGTGLSNEEIADHLVISVSTVKKHVSNTMLKLSARDRAQLVVTAFRSGLVRAPD